jgi:hypothetical protein
MRAADLFFHRTFHDCLEVAVKPAHVQSETKSCPAPCHARERFSPGFSSETPAIYALHFNYT